MCLDNKNPLEETRIKLCNTVDLPVLLYSKDTRTFEARGARRRKALEMKYMRRTAGYTWTDYRTNAQIAKELKLTPLLKTNYWNTRKAVHNM